MNINQAFPSKYLKASDLDGNTITVKIADVKVEAVGRDQDTKPVVYFEGKKKGLVLNKTNSNKIASIAQSHETDEWAGVVIAIYPTEVEFSGESVEAIRVKAPKATTRRMEPQGHADPLPVDDPRPPAAPVTDDDIPF
jgi:hypothetical protein